MSTRPIFDPNIFDSNVYETGIGSTGIGRGASRQGIDIAGGVLLDGSSNVFVENYAVALNGSRVVSHGISLHGIAVMIASSSKVIINNKAPIRSADSATCGHRVSGSSRVFFG